MLRQPGNVWHRHRGADTSGGGGRVGRQDGGVPLHRLLCCRQVGCQCKWLMEPKAFFPLERCEYRFANAHVVGTSWQLVVGSCNAFCQCTRMMAHGNAKRSACAQTKGLQSHCCVTRAQVCLRLASGPPGSEGYSIGKGHKPGQHQASPPSCGAFTLQVPALQRPREAAAHPAGPLRGVGQLLRAVPAGGGAGGALGAGLGESLNPEPVRAWIFLQF